MSEFTDELRDLANEQDAGPNGPEFKKALRTAADLLDEAENALEALANVANDAAIAWNTSAMDGPRAKARAILAKLREPR